MHPQRPELPDPNPKKLPRWRGFGLLSMYRSSGPYDERSRPFSEQDFQIVADWGFDFVRLPLNYNVWTDPGELYKLREDRLEWIDQAIAYGQKYQIHVCLNFHRAPGYCVHGWPQEPFNLWQDEEALKVCSHHWAALSRRYRHIPNRNLSFNPLNEPQGVDAKTYRRVMGGIVEAIREADPGRLIIADGLEMAAKPVPELTELEICQSLHAYLPFEVSCWKGEWWGGAAEWPRPTWPLHVNSELWDKQKLYRDFIEPWQAVEAMGVGVHGGEAGSYRWTPQPVALAWTKDWLDLFKEAGWGWAIWCLRDDGWGPLNSGRNDIVTEEFRGHQLDRELLELLIAS
jgi:endoglucanase